MPGKKNYISPKSDFKRSHRIKIIFECNRVSEIAENF